MVVEVVSVQAPWKLYADWPAQVWSWLPHEQIEDSARKQIEDIASLPGAVHVAIMPDCHTGFGMPIGSVLATKNDLVPNAVGVDIGCGMIAQPVALDARSLKGPRLRAVLEAIYKRVPVGNPGGHRGVPRGFGQFRDRQDSTVLREWLTYWSGMSEWARGDTAQDLRDRADRQLGTLGAGNHFIEIQADENDQVWFMLHTGSRAFGHAIATHHNEIAKQMNERYYSPVPKPDKGEGLWFLPFDTDEGKAYFKDMQFAVQFADESRDRMHAAVTNAFFEVLGPLGTDEPSILTNHNFASVEEHMGRRMIVHRKGAVRTVDSDGVPLKVTIPGSMQTGSYIGLGKPSVLGFNTCSHGAGRAGMGRRQFMRENPDLDVVKEMESAGLILVCPPTSNCADEAGRAYKNIENVMGYQSDLVTPLVKLRPLGTVKG